MNVCDENWDERSESEDHEAEEGDDTVGEGIFLSCKELKFFNHHDFQETFFIFTENVYNFLRNSFLQSHFSVNVNHFCLLRLKIVFDLLSLSLLLHSHVLIICLCSKIVSSSHTQSVSKHGGKPKGEDDDRRSCTTNTCNDDDETGAESIESSKDSRLDILSSLNVFFFISVFCLISHK